MKKVLQTKKMAKKNQQIIKRRGTKKAVHIKKKVKQNQKIIKKIKKREMKKVLHTKKTVKIEMRKNHPQTKAIILLREELVLH